MFVYKPFVDVTVTLTVAIWLYSKYLKNEVTLLWEKVCTKAKSYFIWCQVSETWPTMQVFFVIEKPLFIIMFSFNQKEEENNTVKKY